MRNEAAARRLEALRLLVAALLFGAAVAPLAAQHAVVFALEGEGTSYAVLDEPARTAYLTDGGRTGTAGLAGANVEGVSPLDYLRGRGIEHLVVTCSHPHSDHEGGLRKMVADDRLREYKSVHFVDNGYEASTGRPSLYTLARRAHPELPAGRLAYHSAAARNAFGEIAVPTRAVAVSNFVYEPGGGVHERSVVTEFEIKAPGGSQRVVDLDDAASRTIALWAGQQPAPKASVMLVAHHGSRHNDLSPVLERHREIGIRDVIVTVNRENRYGHPSPEVLERLVATFGADHVFVTAGGPGTNVEVTASGVRLAGGRRNRDVLAAFVRHQMQRHEAAARQVVQAAQARTSPGAVADAAESQAQAAVLTSREQRRVRTSVAAAERLQRTLRMIEPKERRRSEIPIAAIMEAPQRLPPRPPDIPPEARGADGVANFEALMPGPEEVVPPIIDLPPLPPAEGRRRPAVERAARRRGSYSRSIRSVRVRFGGIILGSDVEGWKLAAPTAADWVSELDTEGRPTSVALRVTFADGTSAITAPMTPTEAWVAFHLAQPGEDLRELHPDLDWNRVEEEIGLVGIRDSLHDGWWTFGLHPAIAGTHIGRDGMRVDMAISLLSNPSVDWLPAAAPRVSYGEANVTTYQWYDAPSRVVNRGGFLTVVARSVPLGCLMRLRLIAKDPEPPEWAGNELSLMLEAERRLLPHGGLENAPAAIRGQVHEEMLASFALSVENAFPDTVLRLCREFDGLRTIDDLAKSVALLRWYQEAAGTLPALPVAVEPSRIADEAAWSMDRVFAAGSFSGSGSMESLDPPRRPAEWPPRSRAGEMSRYSLAVLFAGALATFLVRRRRH